MLSTYTLHLGFCLLLSPEKLYKCVLVALVVDVKEFKVSSVLKLLLIPSLLGTQGGGRCMVFQLCAFWDYPGSQLRGDPNYTGGPAGGRVQHHC